MTQLQMAFGFYQTWVTLGAKGGPSQAFNESSCGGDVYQLYPFVGISVSLYHRTLGSLYTC